MTYLDAVVLIFRGREARLGHHPRLDHDRGPALLVRGPDGLAGLGAPRDEACDAVLRNGLEKGWGGGEGG